MFTVHQPFHTDLIEGIYAEAERLGYEVLLSGATPAAASRRPWKHCSATAAKR
ncbi:hypothetical protein ACRAWF_20290 [Streptomyces sp. L7]